MENLNRASELAVREHPWFRPSRPLHILVLMWDYEQEHGLLQLCTTGSGVIRTMWVQTVETYLPI